MKFVTGLAACLLIGPPVFGQQTSAPAEDAALPNGVSNAFVSIDAGFSGLSQTPTFFQVGESFQNFQTELISLKPKDRLAATRAESVGLGSDIQQAETGTSENAATLNQGMADLDNAVGNWQGANDFAQKILQTNPKNATAWDSVSQAELGLGNPDQALVAAKKSAALDAKNPAAWRTQALAYAALGKSGDALAAARQALSLNSSDKDSIALLAALHQNSGNFHLGKIATNWDTPTAGAFPSPVRVQSPAGNSAHLLPAAGMVSGAPEKNIAAPDAASATAADGLLQDAANKIALADYEAALTDAARAAALDPGNPAAYYYQAAADNLRGLYASAVEKATRGLSVAPEDIPLRDERAWSFNRLGLVRDAMADANSALENNPQDPYAYANLSRADEEQGDIRSALDNLRRAASISRNFLLPYQKTLSRYGLAPGTGGRDSMPRAPGNSRNFDFLLILANAALGGILIAVGVLRLIA